MTKQTLHLPRTFITGATGFVGNAIICEAGEGNESFTALVRKKTTILANVKQVEGELDPLSDLNKCLSEHEAVVHCAAQSQIAKNASTADVDALYKINVEATRNLAEQAAGAGVKTFVFISSAKVYGEESTTPFTIESPYNPQDHYARSKMLAEQALLELAEHSDMKIIILRPPMIYGNGEKGNAGILSKLIRFGVPLPFASFDDNKRSFASVETVANTVIECLHKPAQQASIQNVMDANSVSTADFIRQSYAQANYKVRLMPVPKMLIKGGLSIIGKSDAYNKLAGNFELK